MKKTTIFLLIACYYSALQADLQNHLVTLQGNLTILRDVLLKASSELPSSLAVTEATREVSDILSSAINRLLNFLIPYEAKDDKQYNQQIQKVISQLPAEAITQVLKNNQSKIDQFNNLRQKRLKKKAASTIKKSEKQGKKPLGKAPRTKAVSKASTPAIQKLLDSDYNLLNRIEGNIDIFEQKLDEFLEWAKNYAQSTEQNDDVKSPAFENLISAFNEFPNITVITKWIQDYDAYQDTATKQDANAIVAYLTALAFDLHRIIGLIETNWKDNYDTLDQITFQYKFITNSGPAQYRETLINAAIDLKRAFFRPEQLTLEHGKKIRILDEAIEKWERKSE